MILVFGRDPRVDAALATWVMKRSGINQTFVPGAYYAIGVVSGGRIVAGVLYHNYAKLGTGGKVEISMAAEDPRWCQKGMIRALLHYPFEQLGCHVVICTTARSNARARKLLDGLGFELLTVVRNAPHADDSMVYELRRAAANRWLDVEHERKAA